MRHKRLVTTLTVLAAASLVLAGCGGSGGSSGGSSDQHTTVTFRTWDDNAAAAYKESFAEFTKENPNISVDVTVIPWADYFTKLRTDIAAGSASDIFWINNSSIESYANDGALINIDDALGADAKKAWAPTVVQQFTLDGKLWGVPQTSDGGIAMYYNKAMVKAAGLSETDLANLKWDPSGSGDTFLPAVEKLTKDSSGKTADESGFNPSNVTQWGFNSAQDLQGIMLPFIGSNGGTYQNGDQFTFSNPKTQQAFQYMVDLINKYHVSPSAADSNSDGNYTLNQFMQGKMALFESGLYNMSNVSTNAKFQWGTVLMPAGPAGRVSVTNGIVAAGNAKSSHLDATKKVLAWLGSTKGDSYIGKTGANLPAVTAAQQVYFDYWKSKGVDVTPFFDVIKDGAPTIAAPVGANFNAAYAAYTKVLNEIFLGRVSVAQGTQQADDAANKAMNGS